MNPSIDLRIQSMQRALTEVILPAIAVDNPLAQEQARLLLGHLHALALHHRHAARFADLELRASAALAKQLLLDVTGGAATHAAATRLRECLPEHDFRFSAAIEALVIATGIDGDSHYAERIGALVLQHEKAAAIRGRAWFKAMGFDSAPATLMDIETMLGQFERTLVATGSHA
jgi:hypothetical protein